MNYRLLMIAVTAAAISGAFLAGGQMAKSEGRAEILRLRSDLAKETEAAQIEALSLEKSRREDGHREAFAIVEAIEMLPPEDRLSAARREFGNMKARYRGLEDEVGWWTNEAWYKARSEEIERTLPDIEAKLLDLGKQVEASSTKRIEDAAVLMKAIRQGSPEGKSDGLPEGMERAGSR